MEKPSGREELVFNGCRRFGKDRLDVVRVNDLGLRSVHNSDVVDIIFEGSSSCRCALITGAVPSFWSGSLITGVACMSDLDQFFQTRQNFRGDIVRAGTPRVAVPAR